ncbi:MAG: ATP-binding protein [Myxococcales bacterium]|nr:hypothetical protein [Myxococcota bacterium]MDW8283490.1 ATP-binding protein [Myxococcales bacterium]
MSGQPMAIVIDRSRTTARRVARVLQAAGFRTEIREPGEGLSGPGDGASATLLIAEEAAADVLRQAQQPAITAIYSAGEPDVAALLAEPQLAAVLAYRPSGGRLDFESELLGLARHLRGGPLPPLQGLLLWGARAFSAEIHTIAGRAAAVEHISTLCAEQLATSRRVADAAGEIVHELITNAMYDAPVNGDGRMRYAHDRTAPVHLPPEDAVIFRYGTDGIRLALEVEDRFGRLRRADLVASLRRGAAGEVNQEQGGAGIGLARVVRACQSLLCEVEPGRRTRVTAVLDIDPPRAVEGMARGGRSVVFPERPGIAISRGEPEP